MVARSPSSLSRDLVDEVYEALFGAGDWTRLLSGLASVLPDGRAMLVHHDVAAGRGALHLNANVPPEWQEAYNTHFSRINPWMPHVAQRKLGVASNTSAMVTPKVLGRTEFYGDLLRQIDFREGVGITLEREDGLAFALSLLGSSGEDQVIADAMVVLETVAPHLRRAFAFYRGVTSRSASPGLSALEAQMTVGVLRIGLRGTIQVMNLAAERILAERQGLYLDPAGRLTTDQRAVNDALQAWWSVWSVATPASRTATWLLRRPDPRLPLRLTLLQPPQDGARTYFVGPETFVLIEDPERQRDRTSDLSAFYRLTPAEARVLAGLAAGRTLTQVATDRSLSIETVRTQLKSLFAKTGTGTQAELVRLGARLGTIMRP